MSSDIDDPVNKDPVADDLAEDQASVEVSESSIDLPAEDDVGMIDESIAKIDVDDLVAKIESKDPDEIAREREIRQKLEALREQRDDKFASTYNFNLDDDL